mmetsp:Transcript_27537/g.60237  ORF Transcript_27537/g.60237 Transcript_27537/m.60237 type:complete len:243 (+) Transcript_27537:753-1481(+)
MCSVCVVTLLWVVHLPSACREDMLVAVVPMPLHHFARVRVRLLHTRIVHHTHVLVHAEIKQGSRFASCLVDDEFVEGEVLGQDEILLDVHEVVDADSPQLPELRGQLVPHRLEEGPDAVPLLDLDHSPVTLPVPVAVRDLQRLRLDLVLLSLPLLHQLLPQLLLLGLPVLVRQEVRHNSRVLTKFTELGPLGVRRTAILHVRGASRGSSRGWPYTRACILLLPLLFLSSGVQGQNYHHMQQL